MLDVDQVWHLVAEGIEKSHAGSWDSYTTGKLHQMCRSGEAFLILAHDDQKVWGASIWQFRTVDNKPVFQALAFYGEDVGTWFGDMRERVRHMAKMNGAVSLVDEGRPGMGKLFEKHGAKPQVRAVIYEEML